MGFINDKEQFFLRMAIQMRFSRIPNTIFALTKHHVLEHRIVCDENIRTGFLHFKTSDHFGIIGKRDMLAIPNILNKRGKIFFSRNLSAFEQLIIIRIMFVTR